MVQCGPLWPEIDPIDSYRIVQPHGYYLREHTFTHTHTQPVVKPRAELLVTLLTFLLLKRH